MLRIGIIGAARVATYAMIAPAAKRDDMVVAAVASRDAARAANFAATHGIPRHFGDYAAMVADPDIDAIYVATPPAFHLEQARLAIRAGKPCLVEKPFTLNAAEAETLLAEAQAAGVVMVEAQHSLCHGFWSIAARAAVDGIGQPLHIDAWFNAPVKTDAAEFRWDAGLGGGALMDLGVYPLAWVWAYGGWPLAARDVSLRPERQADAAFAATLDLANGVTARVAADMAAPFGAQLKVTGSMGTLTIDNPLAPQRGGHAITLETAAGIEILASPAEPGSYDAQLARFVDLVAGRAAWPLLPDHPLHSMRAIDLVRAQFNQEKMP